MVRYTIMYRGLLFILLVLVVFLLLVLLLLFYNLISLLILCVSIEVTPTKVPHYVQCQINFLLTIASSAS